MFRIVWILWLGPVNVETYSHLATLDVGIIIVIEPVSSGMGQNLVVSRFI